MASFLDKYIDRVNASIMEDQEPLSYLTSRGVTIEDIKKYRLGYSKLITPVDDGSADYAAMKKKTFDWMVLKGKIIYPISACNGATIGLTARRLDLPGKPVNDKIPKYKHVVTAEADKVGAFFGVSQAAPHIIEKGYVYVVEGGMDCISLAKVFPNTVSTLTSLVNKAQMWTLEMLAGQVIVVFDPDDAGRKGAARAESDYGTTRVKIRELGYADPNKCLVDMGLPAFTEFAKRKLHFVSFSRGL